MKNIETERLKIREFKPDDLGEVYRILDVELKITDSPEQDSSILQRKKWLDWTIKGYEQNKLLLNPPYGDNAIILKESNKLIGICGFVPVLAPLGYLPYYKEIADIANPNYNYSETGLFCAVSSHFQFRGFAYESLKALIDTAFKTLQLKRIIAVTKTHNNPAIAVLNRLNMNIEALPNHPWMQIVGILENYLN